MSVVLGISENTFVAFSIAYASSSNKYREIRVLINQYESSIRMLNLYYAVNSKRKINIC